MLTTLDLTFLWSHHLFQWLFHCEPLNISKVECNSTRSPKPGIYDKIPICTDYYCLHILIRTISATYAVENVFCVCIAWYKNERGSRQVCKPETKSRVCVTVKNSPNLLSVYIRLCKHRKKVFYCFYKITFLRNKQNSLQEKFLLVAKCCIQSFACILSSCFAKKMLSKIWIFLA